MVPVPSTVVQVKKSKRCMRNMTYERPMHSWERTVSSLLLAQGQETQSFSFRIQETQSFSFRIQETQSFSFRIQETQSFSFRIQETQSFSFRIQTDFTQPAVMTFIPLQLPELWKIFILRSEQGVSSSEMSPSRAALAAEPAAKFL